MLRSGYRYSVACANPALLRSSSRKRKHSLSKMNLQNASGKNIGSGDGSRGGWMARMTRIGIFDLPGKMSGRPGRDGRMLPFESRRAMRRLSMRQGTLVCSRLRNPAVKIKVKTNEAKRTPKRRRKRRGKPASLRISTPCGSPMPRATSVGWKILGIHLRSRTRQCRRK